MCHGWVLKRIATDFSRPSKNILQLNPVVNTLSPARMKKSKARNRRALFNELYQRQIETLLFSAEQLYVCSEETLLSVKELMYEICRTDTAKIKIVAYVRNPMTLLTSAFQEVVRNVLYYTARDFETFSHLFTCQNMQLQKFIQVFGKENVRVFQFEEAVKHPQGSVGFFYDAVLNVKPHEMSQLKIKKSNEGMSQIAADICLFINDKVPMFNQDRTAFSGHRREGDLLLLTGALTGEKFKLAKELRLSYLDKIKAQIQYLKETFGIEYSIEQMKQDIEMDTEPNHVPTEKNMQELSRIFYKLDPVIQDGVIDYVRSMSELYVEQAYLTHHLNQLKKKKNHIWNKRPYLLRKTFEKIQSEWFFIPARMIWWRYRIRRVMLEMLGILKAVG